MAISKTKLGVGVFGGLALALTLALSGKILETNNEGFFQVKQAAVTGEMTIKNSAGMYFQNFGMITTYQVSDMYYFSTDELDGGDGAESQPINVRFNDGGTAAISGFIKFRLSTAEKNQLLVHKEFKNYDAVVNDLIRQHVASALKQTASLMKAEDTYSSRRSEFIALVEEQIVRGIFSTEPSVTKQIDASGKEFIVRSVKILRNDKGEAIVKKNSPFVRYAIETLDFNIKDIDFDATIDALIAKKKEAQQKMVVAKAQAEEAKQNAITTFEKGKASIAQAKANEEVAKITAVTKAEKEKAVAQLTAQKEFNVAKLTAEKKLTVAQLNKKAAAENAKAKLLIGESEAKVAKLKVVAGLSPLERAQIDMKTQIGVATAMAGFGSNIKTVISGGGSGGSGGLGNADLVRLNQMMDLVQRTSGRNSLTKK